MEEVVRKTIFITVILLILASLLTGCGTGGEELEVDYATECMVLSVSQEMILDFSPEHTEALPQVCQVAAAKKRAEIAQENLETELQIFKNLATPFPTFTPTSIP